ncbi:MAG: hypothetical protein J7L72_02875 [Candidatus Aminicenantes bacterium]|nr:hypothetical protein [Candidatus Aminicenantes bacterium]
MVFSIHFCSYVIPGLTLDSDSLMYWIPAPVFTGTCFCRNDNKGLDSVDSAFAGMTEGNRNDRSGLDSHFRGNDKEEYGNDIYG